MTYFTSCGCAVECDRDARHCPECGDPIDPTPEDNPDSA